MRAVASTGRAACFLVATLARRCSFNLQAHEKREAEELQQAARIAYEVKTEFEKEEAARAVSKKALVAYLAGNEDNKALRVAEKERMRIEDLEYMRKYDEILQKQQLERLARLQKLQEWQVCYCGVAPLPACTSARSTEELAIAAQVFGRLLCANRRRRASRSPHHRSIYMLASALADCWRSVQNKNEAKASTMPESKRWIDPEIIQRNFERNEAARAAEDDRRRAVAVEGNRRMVSALNKQVAERTARDAEAKASNDAHSAAYLATAGAEQARCGDERRKRLQLKLQVRTGLVGCPRNSLQAASS